MLTNLQLTDFLNKVAGNEPVPGGGSVAALNGAIASALTGMVARLTLGKKGYEACEERMQQLAALADEEQIAFTADIDRDSEAYNRVFACFKMPKGTPEEKAARSAAIQDATKHAALVPMQVARGAFQLMDAIVEVAHTGNQNAVTDACVAMMNVRSAVLGALLNVRINLGSIKDEAFVEQLQLEADEMERLACEKEQALIDEIRKELRV